MKNLENKVVFITGVSSGIGLAVAKKFIDCGSIVYGVGRKDFELAGLNYSKVDITNFDNIKSEIDKVSKKEGKIDIVISNAGMGISGPVEYATSEEIEKIFDINLIGSANVIRAVLPVLRTQGYGRIVCTSSVGSYVALPFQAFYSASKAGLDALVDATRSEVKAFGVEILCVHPGDVKTGFTGARKKQELAEGNPYKKICDNAISSMEKDEQGGMPPEYVANKIVKIATKKGYKTRNIIGGKYKFFTFALSLLPRKVQEWAVRKMYF